MARLAVEVHHVHEEAVHADATVQRCDNTVRFAGHTGVRVALLSTKLARPVAVGYRFTVSVVKVNHVPRVTSAGSVGLSARELSAGEAVVGGRSFAGPASEETVSANTERVEVSRVCADTLACWGNCRSIHTGSTAVDQL